MWLDFETCSLTWNALQNRIYIKHGKHRVYNKDKMQRDRVVCRPTSWRSLLHWQF